MSDELLIEILVACGLILFFIWLASGFAKQRKRGMNEP